MTQIAPHPKKTCKKIKDNGIDKRVGNGVVYTNVHEPLPTRFRYAIRFYFFTCALALIHKSHPYPCQQN